MHAPQNENQNLVSQSSKIWFIWILLMPAWPALFEESLLGIESGFLYNCALVLAKLTFKHFLLVSSDESKQYKSSSSASQPPHPCWNLSS
jgi:hypothetical protein